jgi:hypothetical protein
MSYIILPLEPRSCFFALPNLLRRNSLAEPPITASSCQPEQPPSLLPQLLQAPPWRNPKEKPMIPVGLLPNAPLVEGKDSNSPFLSSPWRGFLPRPPVGLVPCGPMDRLGIPAPGPPLSHLPLRSRVRASSQRGWSSSAWATTGRAGPSCTSGFAPRRVSSRQGSSRTARGASGSPSRAPTPSSTALQEPSKTRATTPA